MGVVIGLIILSIMMIVHELGHFLTGRKLGFKIEEFSIFMGPVLFSWTRKDIKYNIKLLPIGASVRFAGEYSQDGTPEDEPGHFFNRPKRARAVVIATGPLLNLLSGVLAFLLMFSIFGYEMPTLIQVYEQTQAQEAGLEAGDKVVEVEGEKVWTTLDYRGRMAFIGNDEAVDLTVRSADGELRTVVLEPQTLTRYRLGVEAVKVLDGPGTKISIVEETSNNANPVLKVGDVLLAVNGIPFEDEQFAQTVEGSAGSPIIVTVVRDGETLDLEMVATQYQDYLPRGVYFTVSKQFGPAVSQSFLWSWSVVKVTLRSVGMIFAGTIEAKDTLSGPVGVVTMISDVVTQSTSFSDIILQLLWLFALVSISLGFMNLLPIPPLDGNHLLLILFEAIRGRRLSERTQNVIGYAGLFLIILLAALGLIFDVMRLAGRA